MRFYVCLVAITLALASAGVAQETTGNITGTITDPTGSLITGAKVIATNTGTGVSRTTESTSAGVFFLNNLPVGNYTLRAELAGFKAWQATNIRVDVNNRLNFAVRMGLGG